MKLLQIPTVSLEQRIKEELESNPALEEGEENDEDELNYEEDAAAGDDDLDSDIETDFEDSFDDSVDAERDEFDFSEYMDDDETPDYKTQVNNHSADDDDYEAPVVSTTGFQERLEQQLGMYTLSEDDEVIARHIIGNLDDAGYLRRELESIVDDLAFTQNVFTTVADLERVLAIIQDLDPPGVGARDLQECLLLQIKRRPHTYSQKTAEVILRDFFDEFTKKHYDKIILKLEIEEEDLRDAIEEIIHLNPKPGNSVVDSKIDESIVPDFYISISDTNEIDLRLNGRNAPELRISRKYADMIEGFAANKAKPTRTEKDAMQFVKQKLDSAKWFIDAIVQRQNTLLTTMQTIINIQYDFFMSGDETKLKPMILKDVADRINMDISTVSRVTNSKYVQTPYGTFLLKYFFSESLSTDDGEEVSTREVKKILLDMIEGEDKRNPLTDQELMEGLNQKGYNIARRTVAKYREQLNLPVARLRREI